MTPRERRPSVRWLAALVPALGGCAEPAHLEAAWTAFGRPASAEVWATTEPAARALLDAFPAAIEQVEASMSLERADSGLKRLNQEAAGGIHRVADRDLFRAVALAVDYGRASDGCYDPTDGPLRELRAATPAEPPSAALAAALDAVGWQDVTLDRELFGVRFRRPGMHLDLDGLAEGYALDVAARGFARVGSLAGRLRLGTHQYLWGRPPGGEAWWVVLDDPRQPAAAPLVRLRFDVGRGVGVSAAPTLDPRTGRLAESDVLVAVAIADSAADAVAVSRALLVGGTSRAGVMLGERTRRVEAVLLVRDHGAQRLVASASLRGRLELAPGPAADVPRFLLPPATLTGRLD